MARAVQAPIVAATWLGKVLREARATAEARAAAATPAQNDTGASAAVDGAANLLEQGPQPSAVLVGGLAAKPRPTGGLACRRRRRGLARRLGGGAAASGLARGRVRACPLLSPKPNADPTLAFLDLVLGLGLTLILSRSNQGPDLT